MYVIQAGWARLVKIGFYLLYHPLAPVYDAVSWLVSMGQWRSWQLAALPHLQGSDILELAHGPGHMLLALNRAGFSVTGIDLSPQMGRLARRRLADIPMRVPLLRAPAQNLPFAAHSFDSVLSTFPTEFIVQPETLNEVWRVLREDGRFVVVPEARLTGSSAAKTVLEFLYRITGQRNVPDRELSKEIEDGRWETVHDRFQSVGFTVRIETVKLADSKVTVVIGTKVTYQSVFAQPVDT